jgi:hypothetical protein
MIFKKILFAVLVFALCANAAYRKNIAASVPVVTHDSTKTFPSYAFGDSAKLSGYVIQDGTAKRLHGIFSPVRDTTGNVDSLNGGYTYAASAAELNCNLCDFKFADSTANHWAEATIISTTTIPDSVKKNIDSIANVEANFVTILARLTALRAGYLDSLASAVAKSVTVATAATQTTILAAIAIDTTKNRSSNDTLKKYLNATITSRMAPGDTAGLGRSAQFTGLAKTVDTTGLARSAQIKDTVGLARSAQIAGLMKTTDTAGLARTSGIPSVASIQSGLALDGTVMHKTDTAGLARTASVASKTDVTNDTIGLARTSGIPSIAGIQSGLAKSTDTMAIKKSSIIDSARAVKQVTTTASVFNSVTATLSAGQHVIADSTGKVGGKVTASTVDSTGKLGQAIAVDSVRAVGKIPAVTVSGVPTTSQIDSQLTATKGAGPWGSSVTYANIITMRTVTSAGAGIPSVPVTFKNGAGTGLQIVTTDINGSAITTLPNGAVTILAATAGYSFAVKTVTVSGNTTIVDTGIVISVSAPAAGCQTVYFIPSDPSLLIDSTTRLTAIVSTQNIFVSNNIITGKKINATKFSDHYEWQLAIGATVYIEGWSGTLRFLAGTITVTTDATKSLSSYTFHNSR